MLQVTFDLTRSTLQLIPPPSVSAPRVRVRTVKPRLVEVTLLSPLGQ